MQAVNQRQIMDRVVGVLKLDSATYEDVEHDQNAMSQAILIVAIVALATGIGSLGMNGFFSFVGGIIQAFAGWIVFSYAVYYVGTKLFATAATEADPKQLMRTMGFAQVPGVLYLLGFIPVLGVILLIIGALWSLATGVVAIRQSLEMSTARAIVTGIVAIICAGIVSL